MSSQAGSNHATDVPPITVDNARNLPTSELARALLGERLASRVIEARRYERDDDADSTIPEYVEFFTQPQLSEPVLNGICSSDVITIEYDWYTHEKLTNATPLHIARIVAGSRYKAFIRPAGDPGSAEYDKKQVAACRAMSTAADSFRAPDAGDAQWLAAINQEYSDPRSQFKFTCSDFADHSCTAARKELPKLGLAQAYDVSEVTCPKERTGDQLDLCFRLAFPYPGSVHHSDLTGTIEDIDPEWVITVHAGMRDGLAPVKIRSLQLDHVRRPIPIS
jgi:hypothetical protein